MKGNADEMEDGKDALVLTYYTYLKVNKGASFKDFLNEDGEVVNTLIHLREIENEIKSKQSK